jgi:transposase
MRTPIFVRTLTDEERAALRSGLRSSDGVVVRRCQMVLASARGERVPQIAVLVGCDEKTVRQFLQRFNRQGREALPRGSSRPSQPPPRAFPGERAEQLRALAHRSPRDFGSATSLWTLDLAAEVRFAQGLTDQLVTGEAIRMTLLRLGIGDPTRQALDHQSRSGVRPKKSHRDRLIARVQAHPEWALGYADAVWWSRWAQPHLHAWAEAERPLRLVEQTVAKADPDPKALACYGLLMRRAGQDEAVWLRFVAGRPVSAITIQFLEWCCPKLEALGVPVWALISRQRVLARE